MHAAILLARWVHVVTGVYWVGAVLFFGVFLGPSASAVGPQAGPMMRELMRRKYFEVTAWVATFTILSGLYLIWQDSLGFEAAWFRSAFGQGISFGMAAAIVAYVIALTGIRPTLYQLASITGRMAQGAPTPVLIAEHQAAEQRMKLLSITSLLLLVLAVSAMAVSRYL